MTEAVRDLIASGEPGLSVTLSAADLRSVMAEIVRREREDAKAEAERRHEAATVSRAEAARLLSVHVNTLDRWAADGYLKPVKIGYKVLYKMSDINRALRGQY